MREGGQPLYPSSTIDYVWRIDELCGESVLDVSSRTTKQQRTGDHSALACKTPLCQARTQADDDPAKPYRRIHATGNTLCTTANAAQSGCDGHVHDKLNAWVVFKVEINFLLY